LIYRVDAPLFFAYADHVQQRILDLAAARGPGLRYVILDAQAIFYLDATATDALARMTADLKSRGCALLLARVRDPVLAVLQANPYADGATRDLPTFPSVRDAFAATRTTHRVNPFPGPSGDTQPRRGLSLT